MAAERRLNGEVSEGAIEVIDLPSEEGAVWYQPTAPGLHRKYLTALLDAGIKAFVIEGYHSGTLHVCKEGEHPGCEENMIPFLEQARRMEVPVFLTFGDFIFREDPVATDSDYRPFDEGKPGSYITSLLAINAGIVPLRANSQQASDVCSRLQEIMKGTTDYRSVIRQTCESFPFKSPLEKIVASASSNKGI